METKIQTIALPTCWYRVRLLGTAAAIALLVLEPSAADADERTGHRSHELRLFYLSIEGRYAWQSGTKTPWATVSEPTSIPARVLTIDSVDPWVGKIAVGYFLNSRVDVKISYTGYKSRSNSASADQIQFPMQISQVLGPVRTPYLGGRAKTDSTLHVVDLNVGYDVGLGKKHQFRVFGGIRYAKFKQTVDVGFDFLPPFPYPHYSNKEYAEGRTWGVGPRLGIQTRIRLAKLGSGYLYGGAAVAGSVLFGQTTREVVQSSTYPVPPLAVRDT